jgi:hypothetical protein
MNAMSAYGLVHGITLHMKSMEYSVLKYGTTGKKVKDAYTKLPSGNKFVYDWLSEKFPKTQDLVYCILGNILDNKDVRYENRESIKESFYKLKSRRESLDRILKSDVSSESFYDNHSVVSVLNRYFAGKISPEYVILRLFDTGDLHKTYEDPKFSYCHVKILNLIKYRDFIPVAKYKPILENHEESIS